MRRLKILHNTRYRFTDQVSLGPHVLMLRPREDHALHIESSRLEISPNAAIRWHRDIDDNSVATAVFDTMTDELLITSELICQHYDSQPYDFIIADSAVQYPFIYEDNEAAALAPYRICSEPLDSGILSDWASIFWHSGQKIETFALLNSICIGICNHMKYGKREEPGVQSAEQTLGLGSGSCRDFANLFIEATRLLGFASRFVSGYLYNPPSDTDYGATHAWAEVYVPGAGWKGFDPTIGLIASTDHIAVAVSKQPDNVPPVAGSYSSNAQSTMEVNVEVIDIDA